MNNHNYSKISNLITKKDVAEKLGCSIRTVDKLICTKAIAVTRVGRSVRFRPEALDCFIQSYTVNAA
jgi:excisionase family DNA binding protein